MLHDILTSCVCRVHQVLQELRVQEHPSCPVHRVRPHFSLIKSQLEEHWLACTVLYFLWIHV